MAEIKNTENNILGVFYGLPERIRTFDLQSRSLTRYPAEPRADMGVDGIYYSINIGFCK